MKVQLQITKLDKDFKRIFFLNLMDKLDWLETGISRKLTLPDVQFVTSDGVVVVRRLHRWSVGVAARRVLHCHYGWHGCDSRAMRGGGMRTPQTPANPSGPVYDMLFSMLRCKLTYCLAGNSIVNRRFQSNHRLVGW